MEDQKDHGFTVRDRRVSSSESSSDEAGRAKDQAKSSEQPASEQQPAPETGQRRETGPLPEVDFSSFILSLTATAQISLGLAPDPQSNQASQNIPAARQMIDLIGLLKEKTKGNLSREEQELIDTVLANLRMLYVRTTEGKK